GARAPPRLTARFAPEGALRSIHSFRVVKLPSIKFVCVTDKMGQSFRQKKQGPGGAQGMRQGLVRKGASTLDDLALVEVAPPV
ncbi:hypothetical protein ABTL77_20440, partial [Acinetobacter baumannii]